MAKLNIHLLIFFFLTAKWNRRSAKPIASWLISVDLNIFLVAISLLYTSSEKTFFNNCVFDDTTGPFWHIIDRNWHKSDWCTIKVVPNFNLTKQIAGYWPDQKNEKSIELYEDYIVFSHYFMVVFRLPLWKQQQFSLLRLHQKSTQTIIRQRQRQYFKIDRD